MTTTTENINFQQLARTTNPTRSLKAVQPDAGAQPTVLLKKITPRSAPQPAPSSTSQHLPQTAHRPAQKILRLSSSSNPAPPSYSRPVRTISPGSQSASSLTVSPPSAGPRSPSNAPVFPSVDQAARIELKERVTERSVIMETGSDPLPQPNRTDSKPDQSEVMAEVISRSPSGPADQPDGVDSPDPAHPSVRQLSEERSASPTIEDVNAPQTDAETISQAPLDVLSTQHRAMKVQRAYTDPPLNSYRDDRVSLVF